MDTSGIERIGKLKLLASLQCIVERQTRRSDIEQDHEEADALLLQYIGDDEIAKVWNAIDKWYA